MREPAVPILTDLSEVGAVPGPRKCPPPGDRIPVLDGIRGVAILLVMLLHLQTLGTVGTALPWERFYGYVVGFGWIGVDLFFVLSGFLITGILYDSRESRYYFRVFYGRRTLRIFPLYYAALLAFLLINPFVVAHLHGITSAGLENTNAANLFTWTYLLNWYEGYKGFNAVAHPLQHFWSLAVEEQFYLVWPLLVLKVARQRLIGVCLGLMALALTLRIVLYWLHFPYATFTWTLCRADSLATGGVVALASRAPGDWRRLLKWARRLVLPALGAVVLGRVLNPQCSGGPGGSPTFFMNTFELTLVGIFFGASLAMAVALDRGDAGHRLLASPFLRFFGKYSYCLYVCHLPIIVIFEKVGLTCDHLVRILHSELLSLIAVNCIGFAVSIAVSFASWHLYEKQWLKLKDLRGLQRPDQFCAQSGAL